MMPTRELKPGNTDSPSTEDARDLDRAAAGRYVLGRFTSGGGYSFYRVPDLGVEEPNAPDTLAALESLRLLGIGPPDRAATIRWLRELQGADGGYPTLTIGWAALRALDVLAVSPARSARAWVATCAASLLSAAGPRDLRATLTEADHLVELLPITGATLEPAQRAMLAEQIEAARDPTGGWSRPGADLETTAIALDLIGRAELRRPDENAIAELLRRSEDPVLGLRVAPDARATAAGELWGGLAIANGFGLGLRYPREIRRSLALLQRADGGLRQRYRALATLHDTWLGLKAAHLLDLQENRP